MRFLPMLLLTVLGCSTGGAGRDACYLRVGDACERGVLAGGEDGPIRCRAAERVDLVYYAESADCRAERNASVPTGGHADTARIPDEGKVAPN